MSKRYERKMKPICKKHEFDLRKKFDYSLQAKVIFCERKSIVPPLETSEVEAGMLVTCGEGQSVTTDGGCLRIEREDPSYSSNKGKGWHSVEIPSVDSIDPGYDMSKFEIAPPVASCRHIDDRRRASNSSSSLDNSGFIFSEQRRRLEDIDDNLLTSFHELSKFYSMSVDDKGCTVDRVIAEGAHCHAGYQLTGHVGKEFCRPEYHLPFAWDCSHIYGSQMISFHDIALDASLDVLLTDGYHVLGEYCRLHGDPSVLTGPPHRSKRQKSVVTVLKRMELKRNSKRLDPDDKQISVTLDFDSDTGSDNEHEREFDEGELDEGEYDESYDD
eukprot:GHVH01006180.1.p1 GENE.GHVH01006180.1~~GHVH01006180.1.p1  ORF type:complete len:329 (+),score=51.01 GHVH01006180.1:754-1740(+)